MNQQNPSRRFAIGLSLVSALGRLVPHAPNVTPLGGSCLFAGSRVGGWMAYLLPLAVMIATDPFAYYGHGYTRATPFIYASFLISVWLGRRLLHGKVSAVRVGLVAFVASLQFFLITNAAVWGIGMTRGSTFYAPGFNGLMACYAAALPFWGRTLAGDLFYTALLFSLYELLSRRLVTAAPAKANLAAEA
jgi:hypothetical protein